MTHGEAVFQDIGQTLANTWRIHGLHGNVIGMRAV